MNVDLNVADAAKFTAGGDWKTGFLRALRECVPPDVLVVRVRDENQAVLATYARSWTAL